MSAPMFATVDYDNYDETQIRIRNPGQGWQTVDSPFDPFFICDETTQTEILQEALSEPDSGANHQSARMSHKGSQWLQSDKITGVTDIQGRPLSSVNEPQKAFKLVSVAHPSVISRLNDTHWESNLLNNKIPFIWNISAIAPEFWKDFEYEKSDINTVVFDIEQVVQGDKFPDPEDKVESIAAQYNDESIEVWLGDDCVRQFKSWLYGLDGIDIIVTYNGETYDLPVLSTHSDFSDFWYIDAQDETAKATSGIIHYDLMQSTKLDQTLTGIRDKGLKTVVEWKIDKGELSPDLDPVEVDRGKMEQLSKDELLEYNKSDVRITKALYELYFEQIYYLHQHLQIPLNQMFPIHDSFPAKIMSARIFWENKIFMDARNDERYESIFQRDGVKSGDESPFQGAAVEINRKGRFSPVYHADVSSMYPNIIRALEIGPDNVSIVDTMETPVERVHRKGDQFLVPDHEIGKTLVIKKNGESQYANRINELYQKRLEYKGKDKTISNGLKVIMNSVYGLNANSSTRYGSLPVGILITAVGRQIITDVANEYSSWIEMDTDGIYMSEEVSTDELTSLTGSMIETELGGTNVFEWDLEEYQAGLFYKQKNYLLLECDQPESLEHNRGSKCSGCSVKRYGVSMKGSHHPPFFSDVLLSLGRQILKNGYTEQVYERAKKLKREFPFGLEELVQQRSMGKSIAEYESGGNLSVQLADQHKDFHGDYPDVGENMKYLTCVVNGCSGEYVLLERYKSGEDFQSIRVDKDYYKDKLDKVFERLDIKLTRQVTFGDFVEE